MREDVPSTEELRPRLAVSNASRTVGRFSLLFPVLIALGGLPPATGAHAQVGTPVADREMPMLEGGKARLLGDVAVSVLVFFRTNQERSLDALKKLEKCRKASAGKPVRWVAVVSGSASKDSVLATLRASGAAMPVLLDEGDVLYGALGLSLHPVAVVVGPDRRLAAFEPLRALDYCAVVTARLRHALGEIQDEEMQQALAPPKAAPFGDTQAALRYRALAAALFKAGNHAKAVEAVRRSLEKDPGSAAAQALLGDILAAQGKCAEAAAAYRKSGDINLSDTTAANRAEGCAR